MRMNLVLAAALALVTIGVSTRTQAQVFNGNFPTFGTATVVDSGVNNAGELGFFWSVARGDRVEQVYSGTGIAAANELDLSFGVDDRIAAPNEVDWKVLLNGTQVGTWIWTQAQGNATENLNLLFAPISGAGTYDVNMLVTNEIGLGGGSIGLLTGGNLTIKGTVTSSGTPEPGSLALIMGLGIFTLCTVRRTRRS